jgi:hypothetical protein
MKTAYIPNAATAVTAEEARHDDQWFRAKVGAAIDDARPAIAHEKLIAEMRERLARKCENDKSS